MNNSSHIPGSRHLDIGRMACTAAVIILCAMWTAVDSKTEQRAHGGLKEPLKRRRKGMRWAQHHSECSQ